MAANGRSHATSHTSTRSRLGALIGGQGPPGPFLGVGVFAGGEVHRGLGAVEGSVGDADLGGLAAEFVGGGHVARSAASFAPPGREENATLPRVPRRSP